ncbi:MAG: PAS domain S-box protein [Chloroflexi bacterium]|nr:PAS domain S-box protein [Ardenticatenaceae bacterium]MBL1130177.1 PAS domain S-box protein [Chloroflexota bacterium]NOG36267.1 PAS domain S-box protein [Chloroflexota bacterium]
MRQITQRQTTLALTSIIFISLLLIIASTWLPESRLATERNRLFFYLFITAVLWLLTWFDWRYARYLTVALITVMTAIAIPESSFDDAISQGVLLPPIMAMVLVGIPGIVGSAAATWIIVLWRSGGEGMYTSPASLVIYLLAISGLALGRLVVDARLAQERDLLQALMDNSPDHIYFKDTASRFVRINRSQATHLGILETEAAIGKTDFDFQPESLSREFIAEEQEMMKTGRPILDRIGYNPTLDGRDRWFSATKAPIYDRNGRIIGLVGISRDVTERIRIEEELRLSEERFAKAFRASGDGISISTLVEGRMIDINNAHTRIFGYSREEIIGHTAYELNLYADPLSRDRLRTILEETGEVHHLELKARRKSGELFDGLFSAEVVNVQGELCIIDTVRDITPQKQATATLQAYARELERSNQDLANFAYIASHDLQEPLRKIQTFSQRLLEKYDGALDERGQDYLRRVDNAAARMQLLIQDVLTYARIGAKSSNFRPVSLTAAVQDVLADLEELLEATRGQVIVGELPTIDADPIQIRQLLQNLISNSLKFHQPDVPPVVQIDGTLLRNADNTPTLQLTITDNGIGFDEKYLPRIFTMFQRLHGRDEYEGTGIGLTLCRRIVERHYGSITAHSQPGAGATFIITLPLKQPDKEQQYEPT